MNGPPLEDAQHAQDDGDADGDGDHEAHLQGVAVLGSLAIADELRIRGHLRALGRHGNQGRLRHGGAETEAEPQGQQGRCASLARHPLGKGLAQREQAAFQTLDEQRQPQDHAHEPDDDVGDIGKGLLQHDDLEEDDNGEDGSQISKRAQDPLRHGQRESRQTMLLARVLHRVR